ncbi:hypothetical protein VN97_g8481 [Penicillium thymicola]|uniref:Uncharacterized protein n=1 Tax=Penicillium thymicola TaxID=293382 RepID=A0AAI9TCP5_PENTH|nr:hypothetical protein VN97_g8481 [Penicillium thymicola]
MSGKTEGAGFFQTRAMGFLSTSGYVGRFHLKSQRCEYPGATLNGETKLKAHERLDLKQPFCLRRICNMPLQHLTGYVPQPQPYYSPLSTDFSSLNICTPSPTPLSHSRSEDP